MKRKAAPDWEPLFVTYTVPSESTNIKSNPTNISKVQQILTIVFLSHPFSAVWAIVGERVAFVRLAAF